MKASLARKRKIEIKAIYLFHEAHLTLNQTGILFFQILRGMSSVMK